MSGIIRGPADLRTLDWEERRETSGASGTLLKASSGEGRDKIYYKMPSMDAYRGPEGLETVTELVVSRLLDCLRVPHLDYDLLDALVLHRGMERRVWLSQSRNYRRAGERKQQLDHYYELYSRSGETPYDFVRRMGWGDYIHTMLAVDYLIINRDRHGANIEVLVRSCGTERSRRLAPLFDNGLSLLAMTPDDANEIREFDVMRDRPVNNFIGSRSLRENLNLIPPDRWPRLPEPDRKTKDVLFDGLDGIVSKEWREKVWEIIWKRWRSLESVRNYG